MGKDVSFLPGVNETSTQLRGETAADRDNSPSREAMEKNFNRSLIFKDLLVSTAELYIYDTMTMRE
jgi:hypothetical protein